MRCIVLVLIVWAFVSHLSAQQQLSLARYTYTPLVLNPATAGASPSAQIRMAYRQQWVGIEGAPASQVLQGELPLGRIGLGLSVTNDQAGALKQNDLQLAYSYLLPLGTDWALRGGLSASVANWRSDWEDLYLEAAEDRVFTQNFNRFMPNAGAGLLLVHKQWSIGVGLPQLFEYDLREAKDAGNTAYARSYRHWYLHTQARFPIQGGKLELRPQLLLRSTSFLSGGREAPFNLAGSPTATDLGLLLHVPVLQLSGGLCWRSAWQRKLSSDDALSIQANWQLPFGLQLGAAYDVSLNAIQRVSGGSFELMLGYAFRERAPKTPIIPLAPAKEQSSAIPITPNPPAAGKPEPISDVAEDPVQPYLVKGLVFDMTSGLTAAGARVTLSNNCGEKTPKAYITGTKGEYRFALKPGCCYTVQVQKDGFKNDTSEQICPKKQDKGDVLNVNLSLEKE